MKHAMWTAAAAESCKRERKNSDYQFQLHFGLLMLLLRGCLDSGHLAECPVPALFQCFVGPSLVSEQQLAHGKPHREAAFALPLASQTGFHLSSQHVEIGMVNLYDIVVTTQSCEDDRCHKSHYRAVFQR